MESRISQFVGYFIFCDPNILHFLNLKGYFRSDSSEAQSRMRGSAFVF